MKKRLLTIGVLGLMAVAFASCGNKDCVCKYGMYGYNDEGEQVKDADKIEWNDATADKNDWDGDCEEVTLSDLGGAFAGYEVISCDEQ